MQAAWLTKAKQQLLELRGPAGAWAYKPRGAPSVEPSVLACLGLLASGEAPASVQETASWVGGLQQADGSVGVSPQLPEPRWPTSYALLLWSLLPRTARFREKAIRFLLSRRGLTWPQKHDGVTGHDTNIPGWPWVHDTHSWVEPTALALLALEKCGYAGHRRVAQGKRMLLDRMIPSGGWNYGNSVMFLAELRPRPAPTGLALLALVGVQGAALEPSLAYLERELRSVRSPQSLCWGLLSLQAWGRPAASAPQWLAESYEQIQGCFDPAVQLSFLLLAAGSHSLDCLGLSSRLQEIQQ